MLLEKGQFTKWGAILCATVLLTGSISGCGSSSGNSGKTNATGGHAANEQVSFNIVVPYQDEMPNNDNPVLKELQKKTKSNIKIALSKGFCHGI